MKELGGMTRPSFEFGYLVRITTKERGRQRDGDSN